MVICSSKPQEIYILSLSLSRLFYSHQVQLPFIPGHPLNLPNSLPPQGVFVTALYWKGKSLLFRENFPDNSIPNITTLVTHSPFLTCLSSTHHYLKYLSVWVFSPCLSLPMIAGILFHSLLYTQHLELAISACYREMLSTYLNEQWNRKVSRYYLELILFPK